MNRLLFTLIISSFAFFLSAQETINGSIIHDDLTRDYILYVPESYTGDNPVPLVLNYHGFGSNAGQQMFYGDFRAIADAEGFIIVHPEGTLLDGSGHWNVGGWTLASTVDDVGFTSALLDSIIEEYNINEDRIYSTGMSNGGYMSFLLACQLSDRIAAIASVTGSMTPQTFDSCNPTHPTPILQIHGTNDGTVPYAGNPLWTKSIQEVMDYWVGFNECNENAIAIDIEDVDPNDGSTVEHIVYANESNQITTEHFKVYNGAHTWPGTVIVFPGTNNDINASQEIWDFFSRYDLNGAILSTNVSELDKNNSINVYPNPAFNSVQISQKYGTNKLFQIYTKEGKLIQNGLLDQGTKEINISTYPRGIYIIKVEDQVSQFIKLD